MKKIIIIIIACISYETALFAQTPALEWVSHAKGWGTDIGKSIEVDIFGNVYSTGVFVDTVDFDPGPGIHNLTTPGLSTYIQKLDSNGNFIWARAIQTIQSFDFAISSSLALDSIGNVFIIGNFKGTVDFNPSIGVFNMNSSTPCTFILKLDSNGNFKWVKGLKSNNQNHGQSISIDNTGNVYAIGTFIDTLDINPGIGVYNLIGNPNKPDIYFLNLDSNGNFIWGGHLGSSDFDFAHATAIDHLGNFYITGTFADTIDIDPGIGTILLTPQGYDDAFILKLDPSGNIVWVKQFTGTGGTLLSSLSFGINNEIILCGSVIGTADFNPGIGSYYVSTNVFNAFVLKLDSTAEFIWVKLFETTHESYGSSVKIHSNGDIYVTGSFRGTFDSDPGLDSMLITAVGKIDIYTLRLNQDGRLIWAFGMGGTYWDEGKSLALDKHGNVYTTGYFKKSVDFDPGPGNTTLTSKWDEDIYIQKLKKCVTGPYIDSVVTCRPFKWIDGYTYYTDNNIASHILIDSQGCDSIIVLNLVIDTIDLSLTVFDPIITANATNVNYQWLNCDNAFMAFPGETNATFIPQYNGNYAVEITRNGCKDTSACVSITSTTLNDKIPTDLAIVYPNPCANKYHIKFNHILSEVETTLISSSGVVLQKARFFNVDFIESDISLSAGVYLLEIKSPYNQEVIRLVKI